MYNKEQLLQMEPAQLLEIAASLGIKVSPNSEKETIVYDILDKAAIDSAAALEASPKRKRNRIAKKDTDKVYTVNGKEGENLDSIEKRKKGAEQPSLFATPEPAAADSDKTEQEKPAPKRATKKKAASAEPAADGEQPVAIVKHRGRKSKAELAAIAAAEAAKEAAEQEPQQDTDAETPEVPETPVAEEPQMLIGDEVPEAADYEPQAGDEDRPDMSMLEQLQEKMAQHSQSEEAALPAMSAPVGANSVWEGDPGDGTDFITVVDLPIEDQSALPTLDMFDRPVAPQQPEPAFQAPVPATANKKESYDFSDFITGNGVLEIMPDSYGFLRSSDYNYLSSPDDIYVSAQQIKKYSLKTGDVLDCTVRPPKEGEKFFALSTVNSINGRNPSEVRDRVSFEHLTPLFPEEKFNLTGDPATTNPSTRIVDLFAPIGKGQRALIVAQPKTGKTILMKDIANAIAANHPEAYIMMLLIDERPEEVTDMSRTVNAEVIASTFDEPAERHVKIAGIVLEKAKRMVECGHDVVIFLDSITRLARAYNTVSPASGKVLTGGVDANALQKPKRFFGAARKIENGGSLTIIATALVDTGSKMDEVIFEEFKGTGNSEIQLDRMLSNKRIFPALNLVQSSTRRDDLLQDQTTLNRMWIVRKFIAEMNPIEAMNTLRDRLVHSQNNEEFLMSMNG